MYQASRGGKVLIIVFCSWWLAACASDIESALETAQFQLDQGNFDEAITNADTAIAQEPGNVAAYQVKAHALFGRAGLTFLDVAEAIVDLDEEPDPAFLQMADVIPADTDLDDLRDGIEALAAAPDIDSDDLGSDLLKDAAFDLGMMEAIEHYALGIIRSDFHGDFDTTGILDTDDQPDSTNAESDLLAFDNHLINAGTDADESFIADIRQTYCMVETLSADTGFTLAEYQGLVFCELSDAVSVAAAAGVQDELDAILFIDDDADGANDVTCATFNPDTVADAVTDCFDADSTL